MAQPVDLVVDRRVLLDVGVARGHVRLGLVVVVVADEVLDPVVGEELAQLVGQLRGERLVRGDDQRRTLHLLDRPGDGRALARARDAEQCLEPIAAFDAGRQRRDGRRLIAGRLELGHHHERHTVGTLHRDDATPTRDSAVAPVDSPSRRVVAAIGRVAAIRGGGSSRAGPAVTCQRSHPRQQRRAAARARRDRRCCRSRDRRHAGRCSRVACAAMRARRRPRSKPRCSTSRSTATLGIAVDHDDPGEVGPLLLAPGIRPADQQRDVEHDDGIGSLPALHAAPSSRRRPRVDDVVERGELHRGRRRRRSATAWRSSVPSSATMPSPKCATIASNTAPPGLLELAHDWIGVDEDAHPGPPGPAATVDLPLPMPPVSPNSRHPAHVRT